MEKNFRIVEEHYIPHDSTLGFMFALLCPGLAILSVPVFEQFQSPALAIACSSLALAHAVIAILYSFKGATDAEKIRGCFLPLFTIGLSCFMLFAAFVVVPMAAQFKKANPKAACQNNLKQWGLVHKMYANEHEYRFPALSPSAGQLAPEIRTVYPEYLTDLNILRCSRSAGPRLDLTFDAPYLGTVTDQSYYYLGYIIDSPETLRAFHDAYAETVAAGGNFESDLAVAAGSGTWGGDTILRLSDDPEVVLGGLKTEDATGPGGKAYAPARIESRIPLMIERPGKHSGKWGSWLCNVLYMDGHVESKPYPGEWPLTEEAFALLDSMDRMGPYVPQVARPTAPDELPAAYWWLPFVLGVGVFTLWQWTGVNWKSLLVVYGAATVAVAVLAISGPSYTLPGSQLEIHHPNGALTYVPAEGRPANGGGSYYR